MSPEDWPGCVVCGAGVSPVEMLMGDTPMHTKCVPAWIATSPEDQQIAVATALGTAVETAKHEGEE